MRDILDTDKNIKNLIFDTTGIGYFEAGKKVPELAELNLLLSKKRSGGCPRTFVPPPRAVG